MKRIALAAALCALGVIALPANARAATPARLSPAAQSLSRCVQAGGPLSVLMLIDESGSLVKTDPFNQRVAGIRAALTGLSDLAETPVDGQRPQVSVLMAGFFGLVRPDPEKGVPDGAWKPVDAGSIDQLLEEASDYESLNHGRATDYATALEAARKLLAARAAEQTQAGAAAPCQALIWFTDGRYSLPKRVGKAGIGLPLTVPYAPGVRLDRPGAGKQAVADGKTFMCEPNGLMDQLQGDRVIRFTVALSTQLSHAAAAFLDAATTGSGDGRRCGSQLSPLTGEYLTAGDGDRLFFAFANLLGAQPQVHRTAICPQLRCLHGVTTFTTVPGLSRFLIRASGSEQSEAQSRSPLELELTAPDGQAVTLRPQAPSHLSVAGTEITQRWVSERAVEVQGDFSAHSREWLGRWSYAFLDPSAASSSAAEPDGFSAVQLYADLQPAVEGSPELIKGVPTPLTFALVQGSDPDAKVTSGPLLRSAHLTASIEDPVAGTSTRVPVVGPKPDGSFSAEVKIPAASTAGFVYLGLTANLSTPGGTPIAPQFRSFEAPVGFPPGQGYPTISPSSLELPSLHGLGDAEGTLRVKGNSVSGGCVWIGAPKIEAPDAAGRVDSAVSPPTAGAHCIRLGKGETRDFAIRLTPSSQADGTVTASVPVHLRSEIVDGDRVVSVPVSFVMVHSPNVTQRDVLLVVLIVLGAILPLLLLHLLNVFGARFPAPNGLRQIVLPVEMSRSGPLRRRDGGETRDLGRGESLAGFGNQPVRGLKVGGVELETIASGSLRDRTFELFRGPYGVATAAGRRLLAGSSQPLRSWRDGASQEVPMTLAGTWIFRFDNLRPAEEPPAERVVQAAAQGGGGGGTKLEGAFFGARPAEPPPAAEPERGGPVEPKVEGELILLISDRPPHDQGGELFAAAEQSLREADELWAEDRPEPEPEPEPAAAQEAPDIEPAGRDGDGAVAVESEPPPRRESGDSWRGSAPEKKSGKTTRKGSNGDFF